VTVGGLAKVIEAQRGVVVKPQLLYAAAKNSKTFPAFHHTDGRQIVPVAGGLEWWDNRATNTATRAESGPTAYEKAQAAAAAAGNGEAE
jgi:hypothetical protein